ncbi:hypothetical protein NFI95_15550 [Acetobacteraceae bacterium KSS8]|uniref:Phage tail protein n=1 Tax=Endosaccharibacter trunci TaxID=2812733 RepID=A0ABT1WAE6_9PROT|nr:hypothetical protein [Acetobacteraceae bacterium KSS8]
MTLTGAETPSLLRVGSDQALVVHKLIGGDRVIQAMGNDPNRLTLAGLFTGPSAMGRAQLVANIRDRGLETSFSAAGVRLRVRIVSFAYTIQDKGAVLPYELVLEVQPTPATTATTTASNLSNLVGPTIGNAITGLSNMASNVSTYASNLIGQAQTIAGQAFPIANMLGAGGLIAKVTDKLTAAQSFATAGINLSQAPAAAAGIITNLQAAGSGLMTTLSQAGANLDGSPFTFANLQLNRANGDIQLGALEAGAQVNQALKFTQLAAGMTVTPPVVHG